MKAVTKAVFQKTHFVDIIAALNELHKPGRYDHGHPIARLASRWSSRLLLVSAVAMGVLVLLAGIHKLDPLSVVALNGVMALAIGIQLLAIAAVLLQISSGLTIAVVSYRHTGRSCQDEIIEYYEKAAALASYPACSLRAVDRWLEQKIKRMEGRQFRYFGGSDKLAVTALVVSGWATWKELGASSFSWEPSPLLFGVAFLLGLAIGGLALARQIDQFNYQRQLLQVAKELVTTADCSESGSAQLTSTTTSESQANAAA